MIFTSQALYALHMLSQQSDLIFNVPLLAKEGEYKDMLKEVLEKGYQDLERMGLIIENQPSEECASYGFILKGYHEAKRYVVLNDFTCAVDVDQHKLFTHVIECVGENEYVLERISKIILLAIWKQGIPLLQKLEDRHQSEATKEWHTLSLFRLQTYYSENDTIQLEYHEYNECTYNRWIIDNKTELIEYDADKEKVRSISGEVLRNQLIKWLKVKV